MSTLASPRIVVSLPTGTKWCSACQEYLPRSAFGKKRSRPDGLRSDCKDCNSERSRLHHAAHREEDLERNRQYREDHPECARQYRAQQHELYRQWANVRSRCNNPNIPAYRDYGGRKTTLCPDGIYVVPEWDSFDQYLADVGERPGPDYELDRIDNDGPYSPENTQWLTKADHIAKHRAS